MYTRDEGVLGLERSLGSPVVAGMLHRLNSFEFNVVKGSMHNGRDHDVTMFIRGMDDPSMIAVIKKPFFPAGAYRAPSGAAHPGESLVEGAVRESLEETGLEVELIRYLARLNVRFSHRDDVIDWTSHVFEARQRGGRLEPLDTDEIAEARWASLEEIQGAIRRVLLEANWELFRYRVALTDLAVERMEGGEG